MAAQLVKCLLHEACMAGLSFAPKAESGEVKTGKYLGLTGLPSQ